MDGIAEYFFSWLTLVGGVEVASKRLNKVAKVQHNDGTESSYSSIWQPPTSQCWFLSFLFLVRESKGQTSHGTFQEGKEEGHINSHKLQHRTSNAKGSSQRHKLVSYYYNQQTKMIPANNKKNSMRRRLALVVAAASLMATTTTTSAFQVQSPHQASHHQMHSSLDYANTGNDVPTSPQFEQNMRNLVTPSMAQQPMGTPAQPSASHVPENMFSVSSQEELRHILETTNQLTVVRFHAPFCKACKANTPQVKRFAQQHTSDITFVEVTVDTRNPEIKQMLNEFGVKKVPYGFVYHPQIGQVEQASFHKRYFRDVANMIESYVNGICDLPSDVNESTQVYTTPYALAV